jgi:hypothetical protein
VRIHGHPSCGLERPPSPDDRAAVASIVANEGAEGTGLRIRPRRARDLFVPTSGLPGVSFDPDGDAAALARVDLAHRRGGEAPMEKIMWLILGGTTFVAAVRAHQSRRALNVGRWALGVLFIVFGAAVNAVYLTFGNDYYADFADASPFPFVRDTWESLVLPNQGFFITLLIVFEATAGLLVLLGGRWTQIGLLALIGFHVGQLAFGGVLWPWAAGMLVALVLLLRAERHPPGAPGTP